MGNVRRTTGRRSLHRLVRRIASHLDARVGHLVSVDLGHDFVGGERYNPFRHARQTTLIWGKLKIVVWPFLEKLVALDAPTPAANVFQGRGISCIANAPPAVGVEDIYRGKGAFARNRERVSPTPDDGARISIRRNLRNDCATATSEQGNRPDCNQRLHAPKENKMSDGWRKSASLRFEGGISWKVRTQSCQPFAPSLG
jgi:hypothetical protein